MVEPIFKRSAGLDVHKKMVMATLLIEQADGSLREQTREFKTRTGRIGSVSQLAQGRTD